MGSFMSIWAVALNVVIAKAAAAMDARNVFFMMFVPFNLPGVLLMFRALTIIYVRLSGLDCQLVIGCGKKLPAPGHRRQVWAGSKATSGFIDKINVPLRRGVTLTIARSPRQLE